jgi:hypothetical protein
LQRSPFPSNVGIEIPGNLGVVDRPRSVLATSCRQFPKPDCLRDRLLGDATLARRFPERELHGFHPSIYAGSGSDRKPSDDPRGPGDEAYAMGLADMLVPQDQVRDTAIKLAAEIGENSPLGLIATRTTMRGDIADRVRQATDHELEEQTRLRRTDDLKKA